MRKKTLWAIQTAHSAFMSWLFSPRILLLLMLVIFTTDNTAIKIVSLSKETGYFFNILEPFIAVCNNITNSIIVTIGYVALISGFPITDGSAQNMIYRISRISWVIGQLLFSFMVGLTFLAGIFGGGIIVSATQSFISDKWSDFTTVTPLILPEMTQFYHYIFVQPEVYSQIGVYGAAIYSFIMNLLSFVIIAEIILVISLYGKKLLAIIAALADSFVGAAFCFLHTPLQWLFPMANSLYSAHKNEIFSMDVMPVWYSVIYFIVVITVLLIIICTVIKKYSIHSYSE